MSLCNSCEDVFMFQSLRSDLAFSLDKLYFFVFLYIFVFVVGDIYMFQRLGSDRASLKYRPSFQFGQVVFVFVVVIYVSASGVRPCKSQMQA